MSKHRYAKLAIKNISSDNFVMTPLELKDYIDFPVKRIYFISQPQGEYRTGAHCHRQEEDEIFIMIQGEATVVLDEGKGLTEVKLKGGQDALRIPHLVWHHFKDMSSDAIIVALSSTNYSPQREDYCEDYQEFQELVKAAKLKD